MNDQLVVRIELMHHAEVIAVLRLRRALDVLAGDYVRRRHDVVALSRGRDDVARDFVKRPVGAQVLLHPIVEEVATAAHLAVGAEQVHEVVGPLVDVGFTVKQPLDQPVAFGGIGVGQELTNLAARRDAARQVERYAPKELDVAGQGRVRHSVELDLREDVLVDEVPSRDRARGGVGRKRARDAVGQLSGVGRCRAVEQLTVNFGEFFRRQHLRLCLPRRVFVLGERRREATSEQNDEQKSLHNALQGTIS